MRRKKWMSGLAYVTLLLLLTLLALATAPPRFQASLPERGASILALPAEHLLQALAGHDNSSSFQETPIIVGTSLQESLKELEYPSLGTGQDAISAASHGSPPTQYYLTYVLGVSYQFENGRAIMKINKGEKHGLFYKNPVVSAEGLVGQVIGLTGYSAKVALLYDSTTKVVVRRAPEGEVCGVIFGDPFRKELILRDIPSEVSLKTGDLLVTDRQENIPENLDVGVIRELKTAPDGSRTARVVSEPDAWQRVNCFVLRETQPLTPVLSEERGEDPE